MRLARWVSMASLALFCASGTELKVKRISPTSGKLDKPVIRTGVDGVAIFFDFPCSSIIFRTLPKAAPAATKSEIFRVPFWIITEATGPWVLDKCDSITVPAVVPTGFALKSSTSAKSNIISKSLSTPIFCFAEIGTKTVLPPHSSGSTPASANCFFTNS